MLVAVSGPYLAFARRFLSPIVILPRSHASSSFLFIRCRDHKEVHYSTHFYSLIISRRRRRRRRLHVHSASSCSFRVKNLHCNKKRLKTRCSLIRTLTSARILVVAAVELRLKILLLCLTRPPCRQTAACLLERRLVALHLFYCIPQATTLLLTDMTN